MMRAMIYVCSLIAAGISFPRLLFTDASRRANFLHAGVQAVDDSYERVRATGRTYHDLKNVAVEWTRADPQLAAKFLCFLALAGWMVAILAFFAL
jgi:hypothetical protein